MREQHFIGCSVSFQDTVCSLLSRPTPTHLEEQEAGVELQRRDKRDEPGEVACERWQPVLPQSSSITLCSTLEILSPRAPFQMAAMFSRSWQPESMDSGCSNSTAFTAACSEVLCAEGICMTTGGRCDRTASKLSTVKVTPTAGVLLLFTRAESGRCDAELWVCCRRWRRPP